MAAERLDALMRRWAELDIEFEESRTALYTAKDRDNLFTSFLESEMFDEASDEAEEYGISMQEAKRKFETVRMTVKGISPKDEGTEVVIDIMNRWTPYKDLYKELRHHILLQEEEIQGG